MELEELDQVFAPYRSGGTMNAWDVYNSIPPPQEVNTHGSCDQHTPTRWVLFNLYATHDGDTIKELVALPQAADRQTGAKQKQVLVVWENTVIPRWAITMAGQLGYHTASEMLATEEQVMTEGVDTGCERCVTQHNADTCETHLPTCDTCLRSYHSHCLTPEESDRHMHAHHTTIWQCDTCHALAQDLAAQLGRPPTPQETRALLRADLHWWKVTWQPTP